MSRQLLILTHPDHALSIPLHEAFRKFAPSLQADQADPATPAGLEKLAANGYEAVVCWAERPDELDLLVRIRKTRPTLPIVLLSSAVHTPEFRTLALEKGATALLQATSNIPMLVGLIEQAVEMRLAARETRSLAAQGRILSREIRELADRTNTLSQESRRLMEQRGRSAVLPLLVSDDPDQAFHMVRAFEKAEIFAPLPILRSGDEAVDYFQGLTPFENRTKYPLPSLLLLDLHGGGMSGLSLLGWIRQQPRLQHLPVIMLSSSMNPEDIQRAYGVQANSYLIKPANFDELVEMVKAINLYWSSLNVHPDQ
jgi:CheY-like chemotaxis protein